MACFNCLYSVKAGPSVLNSSNSRSWIFSSHHVLVFSFTLALSLHLITYHRPHLGKTHVFRPLSWPGKKLLSGRWLYFEGVPSTQNVSEIEVLYYLNGDKQSRSCVKLGWPRAWPGHSAPLGGDAWLGTNACPEMVSFGAVDTQQWV